MRSTNFRFPVTTLAGSSLKNISSVQGMHDVEEKYRSKFILSRVAAGNITMIKFGMGSANAATVMDLLSAINPKACLFLGKCGGLKHINALGDYILPIAAIRGEGTSDDYFPPEIPALPAFNLQKAISTTIREMGLDYYTGYRLYHQPQGLGTRRRIQTIPSGYKGYGHRPGDCHYFYCGFCQFYLHRCPASGIRPAYDLERSKDRTE